MNNELNITGLRHGALAGGIGVISGILFILISKETYLSLSGITNFIAPIMVLLIFGKKERDNNHGGHLKYLESFVYASILIFISGQITTITQITAFKYIFPEHQETLIEESMKASEAFMRAMGYDEKLIDEGLDQAERTVKMSFSYYAMLANSWASLLGSMFLGAIGAFFIKKSRPDLEESSND
jgi:hypothetical protein